MANKFLDLLITGGSIAAAPFTGGLSLVGLVTTSGVQKMLGGGSDDNNSNQIMES